MMPEPRFQLVLVAVVVAAELAMAGQFPPLPLDQQTCTISSGVAFVASQSTQTWSKAAPDFVRFPLEVGIPVAYCQHTYYVVRATSDACPMYRKNILTGRLHAAGTIMSLNGVAPVHVVGGFAADVLVADSVAPAATLSVAREDPPGSGNWSRYKQLATTDQLLPVATEPDGNAWIVKRPGKAIEVYSRDQGGPDNWGFSYELLPPSSPEFKIDYANYMQIRPDNQVAILSSQDPNNPRGYVYQRDATAHWVYTGIQNNLPVRFSDDGSCGVAVQYEFDADGNYVPQYQLWQCTAAGAETLLKTVNPGAVIDVAKHTQDYALIGNDLYVFCGSFDPVVPARMLVYAKDHGGINNWGLATNRNLGIYPMPKHMDVNFVAISYIGDGLVIIYWYQYNTNWENPGQALYAVHYANLSAMLDGSSHIASVADGETLYLANQPHTVDFSAQTIAKSGALTPLPPAPGHGEVVETTQGKYQANQTHKTWQRIP